MGGDIALMPAAVSCHEAAMAAPHRPRIAVVVDRYPCISETFIVEEMRALEAAGAELRVVTCAGPRGAGLWPELEARRTVHPRLRPCLPRGLRFALRSAAPKLAARATWVAASVASRLTDCDRIHGHFLDQPGLVAALLAARLSRPLSLSAHGRDVHVPRVDAVALCAQAERVFACAEPTAAALRKALPPRLHSRLRLRPHGVDLRRFALRAERAPGEPVRLLSVARLVAKKGLDLVVGAAAKLRADGHPVHLRIIGDGPERRRLQSQAEHLGVRLELIGAASPAAMPEALAWGDVFLLPCRRAADGDRDGTPNALLEALAVGVPAVTTSLGAQGLGGGVMVAAPEAGALAAAVAEILGSARLRRALRSEGRQVVEARFDLRATGAAWAAELLRPCA